MPFCDGLTTDTISSVRTLDDICRSIQSQTGQTQASQTKSSQTKSGQTKSGQIQTGQDQTAATRTSEDVNAAETMDSSGQIQPLVSTSKDKDRSSSVTTVLIETISELTGFPVDMLEPSMNLESDLGIDSIKRVEILSKLEQTLDHIDSISSDDIASLKTIEEIINYLTNTDTETDTTTQQGLKKTANFRS